jgi:glycosyltransferase involved in cell wall biosynthesis
MTGEAPWVSVVTPSMDQASLLRGALESVLAQDYPRVESLVMDGGSTDETRAVVASFGERVRFVSEADRGQSHALNKGFARARGEILAWLNCDDRLEPDAVARAVAAFRDRPGLGLVYGNAAFVDERGRPAGAYEPPAPWGLFELANVGDFVCQAASFFSRQAFARAGPLREDLHYAMDWDLFLKIGGLYPMAALAGPPLATVRLHPAAKTARGGWRRLREIAALGRIHSGRRLPASTVLYGLEWLFEGARRRLRRFRPGLEPVGTPATGDWLARTQRRRKTR